MPSTPKLSRYKRRLGYQSAKSPAALNEIRGCMWIFGYGSLMWDGWETHRGCIHRVTAELRGYARTFNKLSVRNWGTPRYPGPTLNLIASKSLCRGIAFEFPEMRSADIMAYLIRREGKNFTLNELPIVLKGGTAVTASVPLYEGPNVLPPTSAPEIAAMALRAKGVSGSCAEYIKGVADHLAQLGIDDPAVASLCAALVKARLGGPAGLNGA
jgi:glutathione-specific gamma-glutamylcyclotransferase